MTRRHANAIQGQFDTPFGPMEFTLTSGIHVHISAGADADPTPMITVNGIRYYTSIHLISKPDGWGAQHPVHMSREGSGSDPSGTAATKARVGIIEAWTAFIGHNEYLLVEGEIRHLNNEIGKAEDDIYVLKEKIRKRDDDIENLLYKEQVAYEARAKFTKKGGFPKPKDWSPTGDVPEE